MSIVNGTVAPATTSRVPVATSDSQDDPASRIGLGLVEISPLATLIGAASAEALASGHKAAAGLPWAVMSVFGALHATKAALACFVSDKVRETLGLQSVSVESSLGLNFPIDLKTSARKRGEGRVATAVWIPYAGNSYSRIESPLQIDRTSQRQDTFQHTDKDKASIVTAANANWSHNLPHVSNLGSFFRLPHCAYAFDRSTTLTLATIIPSEHKEAMKIHVYHRDDGEIHTLRDSIAIVASMSKVIEILVLYNAGAEKLWWLTALAWMPCFMTAITLQLAGMSRYNSEMGVIDMIAGDLPSALHPGGQGKILLGMPGNICHTLIWKAHWGIQTASCLACVIAVFSNLASQPTQIVYIWALFQSIWLIMRVLICNSGWLASSGPEHAMAIGRPWSGSSMGSRRRTLELVFTLAQYQVTIHPRGHFVYQEDILSVAEVVRIWTGIDWAISEFLPLNSYAAASYSPIDQHHISGQQPKGIEIEIVGVVGDIVLRSASWMKGLNLSNVEMVLAGAYTPGGESIGGLFRARGSTKDHLPVTWRYWIPVTIEKTEHKMPSVRDNYHYWVELDAGLRVVGQQHEGKLRDWDDLQKYLQAGILNISLSNVQEVVDSTNIAREATKGFREWLISAYVS
ncbi:hypothetical protein BDZ91DRAFT_795137 [Kalaharituber pfeilii]|nr:hypothetical protein BDZ91DRAFT_795137 [Kalaharituber pfeilii]